MTDLAAAAARDRPVALVRAVPAWVWLAGLVALSAVVRYAFARRVVAPWIMGDEFIYSELAKSLAAHGQFRIREQVVGGAFSALYPVAIAPAYLLFESIPSAYAAAKAINGVLFSLAAVPTYLLARRMVRPGLALAAAVLAVAVPGALYAGMLMTENLFYPLVAAAALALVLALERPTPLRALGVLAAIGVAFLARAQAVVLLPVLLTAPLVLLALERRGPRALVRFRWLYALPAAGVVLALAAQAARGRSPVETLGAYRTAVEEEYPLREAARWTLWHLAHLDVAVGVIPFAALLVLAAVAHRLGPRERAFVAVALALSVWMLLQVGAFASRWALRIEERNMFHLTPLFLVALVVWIERGLPRPRVATALAAAAAAVLPVLVPYDRLVNVSATSDTFSLLVWWNVWDWGVQPSAFRWIALAVAAALALAFALLPRRLAPALPALVLVVFAVATTAAEQRIRTAAIGALFQGVTHPQRDWIDRAVGSEARVAALWSPHRDFLTIVQNEFFSRSVRRVYTLEGEMPLALAQTPLAFDAETGHLLDPDGRRVHADYALADVNVPVAGDVAARDATKGTVLVRTDGALRYDHWVLGIDADRWSRRTFAYDRYDCDGGSLRLRLEQDLGLVSRQQRVVARDADGRVLARRTLDPRREGPVTWTIPLEGEDGRCSVRFEVAPTVVPADVLPGSEDTRALGVRVLSFDWRP